MNDAPRRGARPPAAIPPGPAARRAVETAPAEPPLVLPVAAAASAGAVRGKRGASATGEAQAGATRRTRVAIACQGGGSQTAFTAGALRALLEAGVHERFEIVSLSGASGGAICAALAWVALRAGDREPWARIEAFWRDNAARTPGELAFNDLVVGSARLTGQGLTPSFAWSPASPWARALAQGASAAFGLRPEFSDLGALLARHFDAAQLAALSCSTDGPALIAGAVDTLSGRLARFSSFLEPIRIEHLLASCAVPPLFPAVRIDGGAYWDGLYSDNPPVTELAQPGFVGAARMPQEIWVIKINSTGATSVPERPDAVGDRRNELIGNLSLFQQLDALAWMNELWYEGAFTPEYARRFEIDGPIRIPRCFGDDRRRDYHLPFIEISAPMAAALDLESKLDRSPAHLEALLADGRRQALAFLQAREAAVEREAPGAHPGP